MQEHTASAIRQGKWTLCQNLFAQGQPPSLGVLNTWDQEALEPLLEQGWQRVAAAPSFMLRRWQAKRTVQAALVEDADCLAPGEHALVERLIIGEGQAILTCAEDFDAALALRNRLWCDIGGMDGMPAIRLDPELITPLEAALLRPEHGAIRQRIFSFDGMIHAMLYASGFLDDALPRARFIADVLERAPEDVQAQHLARNFMEAAYDCVIMFQCRLLVHEGLALPEAFVEQLAMRGQPRLPEMTPTRMLGCMNGLLPEEKPAVEALERVLQGALRPELSAQEAAEDLKLLVKQGADLATLRDVAARMLCVLPTPAIQAALRDLVNQTPKWLCDEVFSAAGAAAQCHWGVLQ